MKITEFLVKKIVGSTDSLVGFDEDGKLVRVSIPNLKSSLGVTQVAAQSIAVQYSLDSLTWHTSYTDGDRYMRIKCGSGDWSNAICIKVSAYETWKEKNGGTGTVEQFLASIKGAAGQNADISQLKISDLSDYDDFISDVNDTVATKTAALTSQWAAHKQEVLTKIAEMKSTIENSEVSKLQSVNSLSDADLFSVKTSSGMRQITLDTLLDNLAVKMISKNGFQRMTVDQRKVFPLKEAPNGTLVTFTTSTAYVLGTSQLYINGSRLIAGTDYLESSSTSINLLTRIPVTNDIMVFIAVSA